MRIDVFFRGNVWGILFNGCFRGDLGGFALVSWVACWCLEEFSPPLVFDDAMAMLGLFADKI